MLLMLLMLRVLRKFIVFSFTRLGIELSIVLTGG